MDSQEYDQTPAYIKCCGYCIARGYSGNGSFLLWYSFSIQWYFWFDTYLSCRTFTLSTLAAVLTPWDKREVKYKAYDDKCNWKITFDVNVTNKNIKTHFNISSKKSRLINAC